MIFIDQLIRNRISRERPSVVTVSRLITLAETSMFQGRSEAVGLDAACAGNSYYWAARAGFVSAAMKPAPMQIAFAASRYATGDSGLPVVPISQVMISCAVPPKSDTATAYTIEKPVERTCEGKLSTISAAPLIPWSAERTEMVLRNTSGVGCETIRLSAGKISKSNATRGHISTVRRPKRSHSRPPATANTASAIPVTSVASIATPPGKCRWNDRDFHLDGLL